MGGADLRQYAVPNHEVSVTAERRIRHHRHVVLPAPWQNVSLDVTVVETVGDLIGRAAIAVLNAEQILHLGDVEVGYAPGADLSRRPQLLESGHHGGELGARDRPMQQIEVEIAGAKTREARGAGTRDAVARHLVALDLGDEEDAVALTRKHVTQEFLRATPAVISRGIEQRHAERNAGSQRLLLDCDRMPSLTEMPAALTERRYRRAVRKLDGTHRRL